MSQYPISTLLARAREGIAEMARGRGPADHVAGLLVDAIERVAARQDELGRRIEAIEKAQPK